MNRSRNAFTLVEMLVATLLTTLVMLAVFGGLTFIGSGYRRDELTMARHRVASQVFEMMADDLAHASGMADPGACAEPSGYTGSPGAFVLEPHSGAHVVHSYDEDTARLRALYTATYEERARTASNGWAVDVKGSRFFRSPGLKALNPWGVTSAVLVIPLPFDNPDVTFVSIAKRKNGLATQVLWSFWHRPRVIRKRRGLLHYNAGTIERFGEELFRFDLKNWATTPARLLATVSLKNEFVHEDGPDGGALEPVELLLEIGLREPDEPLVPFVSPPFSARRTFTAGL